MKEQNDAPCKTRAVGPHDKDIPEHNLGPTAENVEERSNEELPIDWHFSHRTSVQAQIEAILKKSRNTARMTDATKARLHSPKTMSYPV